MSTTEYVLVIAPQIPIQYVQSVFPTNKWSEVYGMYVHSYDTTKKAKKAMLFHSLSTAKSWAVFLGIEATAIPFQVEVR